MALVKAVGIKRVINLAQTGKKLPNSPDLYDGMSYIAVGMSANVPSEDFAPKLEVALDFILQSEKPVYQLKRGAPTQFERRINAGSGEHKRDCLHSDRLYLPANYLRERRQTWH